MAGEHETLLRQQGYCSDCLSDSDWSESSLSSSCSTSSSDHSYYHGSSHHEWKNEIMPNGQVFHIRSEKLTLKTVAENTAQPTTNGRNGREKSTTEKLVRLIRRRNSRRTRKKHVTDIVADSDQSSVPKIENAEESKAINSSEEVVSTNKVNYSYSDLPYGVMYFHVKDINETNCSDQGLVYCYPRPVNENLIYNIKGALVMLYQLLSDITVSPLTSSSVIVKNNLCHIVFTPQNFELMVLFVPDSRCSRPEALAFTKDVVCFLQFSYQSLSRCFSSPQNHDTLDHLFSVIFAQLLSKSSQLSSTGEEKLSVLDSFSCSFEQFAPAAHRLPLPRDAQVQIDDALSELESNDFSEISDAHFGCQRLYTIVGTCLFYKSYLLATHLNQDDLVDVVSFCRHHNLLRTARDEVIKSMLVWREVYLKSCDRGVTKVSNNSSSYKLPNGRWFLLVVGLGHEMLAVLLESGGCTVKAPENPSPDPFYVRQALETLEHIIRTGVISLVEQSVPQQDVMHGLASKLSSKSADSLLASHSNFLSMKHSDLGSASRISAERVSLTASCGGEDTSSSITSDVGSAAPGPVLGRRALREKALSSFGDSNSHHFDSEYDLSDSDLTPSQTDLANLDSSFISKSSMNSNESSLPFRISTVDANHLFHFIQLDRAEGILLSRSNLAGTGSSQKLSFVINNFTKCVYNIQRIFENSIKFKRMNGLEVKGSVMNNSLIAIKEQGILFEYPLNDSDSEKKVMLTYWVVGRLFFLPHPREIYVCYEDTVPQNMVEIAFRIALSCVS
nr:PREDICTED: protein inturned [Bemisia tabaci]